MRFDVRNYIRKLLEIKNSDDFSELSLSAFYFQYNYNKVYNEYCSYLRINPSKVSNPEAIPFLPISLFKTHKVVTTEFEPSVVFYSSSTTGQVPSKHYVCDEDLYRRVCLAGFKKFYGNPKQYAILGLLPAYLERTGSSLVYMVDYLIKYSDNPNSGFYLHNHQELFERINELETHGQKYILIGVSFALLDFIENYSIAMKNGIVMETGGMKGRRKELVRAELHSQLKTAFGLKSVHSEYGMTELLSQAYMAENGLYKCSDTMKVLVRETNDPLSVMNFGTGALNIIDLANIYSSCFIQSSDLGTVNTDGSFSVSGRFDSAEVRGCNLMVC